MVLPRITIELWKENNECLDEWKTKVNCPNLPSFGCEIQSFKCYKLNNKRFNKFYSLFKLENYDNILIIINFVKTIFFSFISYSSIFHSQIIVICI